MEYGGEEYRMPNYTENLRLILPNKDERYDVEVANTNNKIVDTEVVKKVDKKLGKDLSTNDFTNEYKQKLDNLQNYNDAVIKTDISNIKQEQITQNTAIQKNADDIALANETIEIIQEKDTTQDELIKTLQEEKDAEIAQLQEKYNDIKKQLLERTNRRRIYTFKG